MQLRPETATSEQQLLLALNASGRPVTRADLVRWRKEGLLPALAARGLGQGRGKSYHWHAPDIFPQARAVFDLLADRGRPDAAIRMLWLSGFDVPLSQLRRAWLHGLRAGKSEKTSRVDAKRLKSGDLFASGFAFGRAGSACGVLLGAALALGAAIGDQPEESRAVIPLIETALARLGHAGSPDCSKAALQCLWSTICMIGSSPEGAALIARADAEDMRAAQRHLVTAARFLQNCSGETMDANAPWSRQLAEQFGAPLFILILALLRSGAGAQLERIAADIQDAMSGRPGRRERPPARIAVLHA